MDKKAIFFDIDGTLFLPSIGIPASTKKALNLLKENGHSIIVCTGRARSMVPSYILDLEFDGIIAGAGTYVEYENKVLYERNLDSAFAEKLISDLRLHGLVPLPEGHKQSYYDGASTDPTYNALLHNYFKEAAESMIPIPYDYSNIEVAKVSAYIAQNSDKDFILNKYSDSCNIVIHQEKLLEIIPGYSSKAVGIEKYLEHTGIDKKNTYAYGDSMNDYEMLKYVNFGVAMGNASDDFKKQFSYVADSIFENGIYNSLKSFELI